MVVQSPGPGYGARMARSKNVDSPEVDPAALDLGHLALFVGQAVNTATQAALAGKGFGDVRTSHGYVIQHLVAGPRPIGDVAERLGVSQQAASKAVVELEGLGYVERLASPDDKRVTHVGLTARGKEVVNASRKARAAVEKKLVTAHGDKALASARATLAAVLDSLGGSAAVRERRVKQPR